MLTQTLFYKMSPPCPGSTVMALAQSPGLSLELPQALSLLLMEEEMVPLDSGVNRHQTCTEAFQNPGVTESPLAACALCFDGI